MLCGLKMISSLIDVNMLSAFLIILWLVQVYKVLQQVSDVAVHEEVFDGSKSLAKSIMDCLKSAEPGRAVEVSCHTEFHGSRGYSRP